MLVRRLFGFEALHVSRLAGVVVPDEVALVTVGMSWSALFELKCLLNGGLAEPSTVRRRMRCVTCWRESAVSGGSAIEGAVGSWAGSVEPEPGLEAPFEDFPEGRVIGIGPWRDTVELPRWSGGGIKVRVERGGRSQQEPAAGGWRGTGLDVVGGNAGRVEGDSGIDGALRSSAQRRCFTAFAEVS